MSPRLKFLPSFLGTSLGILFCLAAVSAFSAQSDQGMLEIKIKDHRDAIGDFAKLNIVIDKLLVSPKTGLKVWRTGWNELIPTNTTVDLTQYVGKKTATVFRGAIDAGSFDAFHLKLKGIEGSIKKNNKTAPVKNTVGPVKLSFAVPAKGETVLIVDLTVMDMSDHPPRGYELSLKGYELIINGKRIEKVPPG
jgi:hypothetical protein